MIREIENEEHLAKVVNEIGDKPFKVIITSPSTCAPCRRLEELIKDKETDEEVPIVDVRKETYTVPFIVSIRSVPTLLNVSDGQAEIIGGGIDIKNKIEWNN